MITTILANFLGINEQQASTLLKLLTFERRFQQEFKLKDETLNPAAIKTQGDLIKFLQAIGQSKWFQGHDRSAFTLTSDEQINCMYYSLFTKLGLTQPRQLTQELKNDKPDVAAILGSTEKQVKFRLQTFEEDIRREIAPSSGYVMGLGCIRQLGKLPLDREQESVDELKRLGKETHEANMVDFQVTRVLTKFPMLQYIGINTVTNTVNMHDSKARATTADTAVSLKNWLDKNLEKELCVVAAYSNAPFIFRQQLDMQCQLGLKYHVVGVGPGLPISLFETHLQNKIPAVATCLGEIARLTNTRFNRVSADQMAAYTNTSLTESELAELNGLCATPGLSIMEQTELLEEYNLMKLSEIALNLPPIRGIFSKRKGAVIPKEISRQPEEMIGFGLKQPSGLGS